MKSSMTKSMLKIVLWLIFWLVMMFWNLSFTIQGTQSIQKSDNSNISYSYWVMFNNEAHADLVWWDEEWCAWYEVMCKWRKM